MWYKQDLSSHEEQGTGSEVSRMCSGSGLIEQCCVTLSLQLLKHARSFCLVFSPVSLTALLSLYTFTSFSLARPSFVPLAPICPLFSFFLSVLPPSFSRSLPREPGCLSRVVVWGPPSNWLFLRLPKPMPVCDWSVCAGLGHAGSVCMWRQENIWFIRPVGQGGKRVRQQAGTERRRSPSA